MNAEQQSLFYNKKQKIALPVNIKIIDSDYKPMEGIHSHDFFQIFFIDQGVVHHTIESERDNVVAAESISVIFPKQLHQIQFSEDTQGVLLMFDEALFCSDILKNELKGYNYNLDNKLNYISSDQINYKDIRYLVDNVIALFNTITPIKKEQIRFYIKILLLQLIEAVHTEIQPSKEESSVKLFAQYKELVDTHYNKNMTVGDFAQQLGVSTKKLNQVCRNEAKNTPLTIIHERIMVEARRLLMFSSENMKEIAFTLGFNSPSSFHRFIYSQTNQTPIEFKNMLSQKDNIKA